MAGEWAAETFGDTPTNMVVLEGTTGSAPANDRAEGFDEAIAGTATRRSTRRRVTSPVTVERPSWRASRCTGSRHRPGLRARRRHGTGRYGAIEAAAAFRRGHPDRLHRCCARRHAGAHRRQDQLHRRVQPLLGELAAGLVNDVLAGTEVESALRGGSDLHHEQAEEALLDRLY